VTAWSDSLPHEPSARVWTVGHSTHTLDRLVELLAVNGVAGLADVRTVPRSRRHPHFDTDALARSLPPRGVAYTHLARLGGWRRAAEESPNGAWRNASFRGYADYALTDEFAAGLAELRNLAAARPTAIMCAESLWWRCHRRLVADHLLSAGVAVSHIGSDGRISAHRLTPFAVVGGDGRVTYPEPA
jgi:uncharacterized protein (DUF488 family)